jgi:hypothetical protein
MRHLLPTCAFSTHLHFPPDAAKALNLPRRLVAVILLDMVSIDLLPYLPLPDGLLLTHAYEKSHTSHPGTSHFCTSSQLHDSLSNLHKQAFHTRSSFQGIHWLDVLCTADSLFFSHCAKI